MTSLESMLSNYGLFAVFAGTFLEGETILVLAGLAAHRGYLPLPAVITAGFLGTMLGDQLYFHLGRWKGDALMARWPRWADRVAQAHRFLKRHHVAFIFGFRFMYGLRTISPFAIGMTNVRLRRYVSLNALGGLVWSVAVALLGYSVGEAATRALGRIKHLEGRLFLAVAAIGGIVWLRHILRSRSKQPARDEVTSLEPEDEAPLHAGVGFGARRDS